MSFVERVLEENEKLREVEGACGICHGALETIVQNGGTVSAYEEIKGIRAVIKDDAGQVIGEGFDIVWSPAILAAEIDAGLLPARFDEPLRKDALSSEEDIEKVASIYGYGRVLTPGVVALQFVNELGGRTLIKRDGLGVVATMLGPDGRSLAESSRSYCPTCAIAKAGVSNPEMMQVIASKLEGVRNTGKMKFERHLENRYEVKGGGVKVSILEGEKVLADKVIACCIAYGTTKAEIAAGLIPMEGAKRFKAYCNLCPMKHCWMEKSMGATGNIVLHRLSEIGTEIEVSADGLILAKIPGKDEVIEGRGTLCSLSALTNMLLRTDAVQVLRPSSAKRFPHSEGPDQQG